MKSLVLVSLFGTIQSAMKNGHEEGISCGPLRSCIDPGDCCGTAVPDLNAGPNSAQNM